MKKIKLFALLIFCNACSEADFQKIDKVFGIEYPTEVDSNTENYYIELDSANTLQPFVTTPYDSEKVAQKAQKIKENILSKKPTPPKKYPKPIENGWRKYPNLVRAYEEEKALRKARQDLIDIYSGKKRTTKDTAKK